MGEGVGRFDGLFQYLPSVVREERGLGGLKTSAIERPSCGLGCIGAVGAKGGWRLANGGANVHP